jgi:hypothetical protein
LNVLNEKVWKVILLNEICCICGWIYLRGFLNPFFSARAISSLMLWLQGGSCVSLQAARGGEPSQRILIDNIPENGIISRTG